MTSKRGNVAVLFLLLLYWENVSAQSFSYYYRPGPGSEGSFNLGSPQPQNFPGFSAQPPFSGGTPPPGAQFYQYTLPGGNDVPTQQPRVVQQPIQYYQPQQQQQYQQQQHQQQQHRQQQHQDRQPIHQFVQPQAQQFIPQPQAQQQQPFQYVQPQRVEVGSQQHQSPTQQQPSQAPQVIQQIDNGVSQAPFEIRQFYVGQQPTYAPVGLNNIGNGNRAEAINNPKGTVDIKESSEKITLETKSNNDTVTQPRIRFPAQTVTLSVTHTKVREVETEESSEEVEEPTPVRTLPRVTSTAAAVTTRATTVPTTIRTTTTPEAVTTEQTRATVNDDQYIKPSPSSETPDARSPFLQNVFPRANEENSEGSSPFLPNQFSPQTQQFLPTRFTARDPQSEQYLPNQFPPSGFSPNHFTPQNQYQGFPHQFPPQHHQFTSPEQYFQNQFPSADPPRPVHVTGSGGNRQEESFTFRPFPSEIPEIDNNSGEIEDEPQPFVSSTIPAAPSPSPVPVTTTSTSTARSTGRNGKSYYKFATPAGLYDTGTAVPLQQYSITGSGDQSEEQQSPPPAVRKGRKRIRVNRNRFRQRPAIEQPQIQAVIPETIDYQQPIVSQAPVFVNSVTPSPEEDVTTYRSKFRFVPRTGSQSQPTRRPIAETVDTNPNVPNEQTSNTNTDESAQDAINRRLQTLQRQIRFKTSNKNQDRKSG